MGNNNLGPILGFNQAFFHGDSLELRCNSGGNTAYNQSHLESSAAEGLRQKGPWYSKMGF